MRWTPLPSMSRFTRDDARYWTSRPADHTPAGLFAEGPQEALPLTARLVESNYCREPAPIPHEARRSMRLMRMARLSPMGRLSAAVLGARTVNRKRRRAA